MDGPRKNLKPTTTLAFLNADWRDFESTPAVELQSILQETSVVQHAVSWVIFLGAYRVPHHSIAWNAAKIIFKEYNLTVTDSINIFLNRVRIEGGLPFPVKVPSERLREAMGESV